MAEPVRHCGVGTIEHAKRWTSRLFDRFAKTRGVVYMYIPARFPSPSPAAPFIRINYFCFFTCFAFL